MLNGSTLALAVEGNGTDMRDAKHTRFAYGDDILRTFLGVLSSCVPGERAVLTVEHPE